MNDHLSTAPKFSQSKPCKLEPLIKEHDHFLGWQFYNFLLCLTSCRGPIDTCSDLSFSLSLSLFFFAACTIIINAINNPPS